MTAPKYRAPVTLAGVVDELLNGTPTDVDWPVDHRCTKTGPSACDHGRRTSLLDQLTDLVEPGRPGKTENGTTSGKKPAAPAPWSTAPAELLDGIHRGAVELANHARRVLGFGPLQVAWMQTLYVTGPTCPTACEHQSCRLVRRGAPGRVRYVPAAHDERGARTAMRDLLRLVDALEERDPEHHLVCRRDEQDRRRPGAIEVTLRSWHRQATILTGHSTAWPRLRQIPNPHRDRVIGPAHPQCTHLSCAAIRLGRPPAWMQARCPHCHSASLAQDPTSGSVVCLRPSCRDATGRRHEWSVEELKRLGLILETEPA